MFERKGVVASNKDFIKESIEAIKNSSEESSIYIGCDSQRFKKKRKGGFYIRYSVVIIIHINSCNGGRVFHCDYITRDHNYGKDANGPSLKMKLLTEVQIATETALQIVDYVGNRHMELHIDINPDEQHASSVAAKEARGWATGLGFITKLKPEGWAATHAADWAVRGKYQR